MSYSRWYNSKWYTWWDTSSGEDKNSQVIAIWHLNAQHNGKDQLLFDYKQVVSDQKAVIKKLRELQDFDSNDEIELIDIMNRFKQDMDERYGR